MKLALPLPAVFVSYRLAYLDRAYVDVPELQHG